MNVLLILGCGILGAVFGSFFNCVIYRSRFTQIITQKNAEVKNKLSFWSGRSVCPKCGHKLGFWDLIPVFSFIFLRGRCGYCGQKISWQYPIVELVSTFLFIFVAIYFLQSLSAPSSSQISNFQFPISNYLFLIRDLFFVSFLLLIFVFDLKYGIIPDRISIPAIFIAIIFGVISALSTVNSQGSMVKLFLAILVGGGFFLAQHLVSKGKWIGGGDIRLGALMGAMLSWPNVLIALFLAYVAGAVYGIVALILKKKTFKSAVPFGTFLAASTFITLFYGTEILNWYLRLLA